MYSCALFSSSLKSLFTHTYTYIHIHIHRDTLHIHISSSHMITHHTLITLNILMSHKTHPYNTYTHTLTDSIRKTKIWIRKDERMKITFGWLRR